MAGNFYFKAHRHPEEVILAVCDEEILGQTFSEGDLRITVGEGFYGGDIIEEEELTKDSLLSAVKEVYGNRDKYKDAMAKSGQMDSIATIIDLINSQVKKSS